VTVDGSAAGKVNTTLKAYEDEFKTLVLDVTSDFEGAQLTISGPKFTDFSAVSAADNLELEVNDDDVVSATDDKTITIAVGGGGGGGPAADHFAVIHDGNGSYNLQWNDQTFDYDFAWGLVAGQRSG